MEIWGVHSFENEDAREWCQAYREMGLPVASSTIDVALGDFEHASLSAGIACRAIAAIEAVAYAIGRGSPEAMQAFQGAQEADPQEAEVLIDKCNRAIKAITGGSGLSAHWTDANPGDHDAWIASISDLQERLNGGGMEAPSAPPEPEAPRDVTKPRPPTPPQPAAVDTSLEDQLNDIRAAIGGLETDIEVMRQEIREALIEIAKRIARGSA